jgi:hypothetical protein
MSDKPIAPPRLLPRVVIEQQPDGSLVMESYINGARHRELINKGFEAFEIREALAVQASAIIAAQERKLAQLAEETRNLHNRVWRTTAERHGIGFANRTVNGVASLKQNAKKDEKTKPDQPTIKELLSLI